MATKVKAAKAAKQGILSPEQFEREPHWTWWTDNCPVRLSVGDAVYLLHFDQATGAEVLRVPGEILAVPQKRAVAQYRVRVFLTVTFRFGDTDAAPAPPVPSNEYVLAHGWELSYVPPYKSVEPVEKVCQMTSLDDEEGK